VQVGAVYALQILMHPLGIRKVSKINVAAKIKVCDTQPHSRFASVESLWLDTNHLKKCMYVCARCFVQCCRAHCVVLYLLHGAESFLRS